MLDAATSAPSTSSTSTQSGPSRLPLTRYFTANKPSTNAFDLIEWEKRDVVMKDMDGEVIFEQLDVEVPKFWSLNATNIVASKYFRGHGEARESSVKTLIDRVVVTIAKAACDNKLVTDEGRQVLEDELRYLCVNQMMAYNSPVWFNVGTVPDPQCSACFILQVDDNMESILNWSTEEGYVFRKGSGAGVNISKMREKNAKLAGGGFASGPLSFAMGVDRMAGAIKSGGKTRRAAKMLVMDVDHPDIEDFVMTKVGAEKVVQALIAAGFSSQFNKEGGAYELAPWQNANNSVRVTDDFMVAVEEGQSWGLKSRVKDGGIARMTNASDLLDKISQAAWECGDPGMQFHDTVNKWHTCIEDGEIDASNPCCFVGDTLVDTSEGRITIAELAAMSERGEDLPYAFSHDLKTGLPALRQIKKGWKAGDAKRLVKVTTDKGVEVICTPEHRFLTYDGQYVEAQDMKAGTRLRKIARWENEQRGGRYCLNMKATNENPGGTVWQNRFMWEQVNGPIPEGMHVHHVNGDSSDDRMSNFELVEAKEHQSDHSKGSANARFLDVAAETMVEVWETIEATPRQTHKNQPPVTPARWNAYIKKAGLDGQIPQAASPTRGGLIQGMPWTEFESWVNEQRDGVNDRVVSVEHMAPDFPVAVYDIEVDGVHNFAVSAGDTHHSLVVSNSEYMFLNNTACNLASLNLMKFRNDDGSIDVESYCRAVEMTVISMEAIVSMSSYPTENISKRAKEYRTLGVGYANLGALLMANGLPYDSPKGRDLAGGLTSLMSAVGYRVSGEMAESVGAFTGFFRNQEGMSRVMQQHAEANEDLLPTTKFPDIVEAAQEEWEKAVTYSESTGLRNAQISVLAPTGTISFFMDCDTTGVEPDLALVKYKKLVGGGTMKIVNQGVGMALKNLGYSSEEAASIVEHIEANDTIEGAPHITDKHLAVFDCSFKPHRGERVISPMGHVKMMAACQPFLSGAISKTVNLPRDATVEDVRQIYVEAWKMGLKAIAIYRDGCKESQPLNVDAEDEATPRAVVAGELQRRAMPKDRRASVHKFGLNGHEGYLTLGYYPDGQIGELFLNVSKQGSTLGALLDAWATMFSIGLQYGIPVEKLIEKFKHTSFEPAGFTGNPDIPTASSILDYVVKMVEMRASTEATDVDAVVAKPLTTAADDEPVVSGPPCSDCGHMTVRAGACHKCNNCGTTTGCG